MDSFRQTNKWVLLLWGLFLSLSLLCTQEVKLHVHNLDHGHNQHHDHIRAADGANDHSHLSKAHFAHDTSHSDHHDGSPSEINVSPEGVLKNISNNVFAIALFTFFFVLMTFVSSRQLAQRYRENKLVIHEYYVLSPPLRAPPLH